MEKRNLQSSISRPTETLKSTPETGAAGSDGGASVVGTEECVRREGGEAALHLKRAASAPAAALASDVLGNDHPQECQARPSGFGSASPLLLPAGGGTAALNRRRRGPMAG